MRRRDLLELASGWRVPDDEGRFERYLKQLDTFSREATQDDFWAFIVDLRKGGLGSQADYAFTVFPAVRLYIERFGETPGRLIVGYMEASQAGEEEDEERYFSRLLEVAPGERFTIWLSVLHRSKVGESVEQTLKRDVERLRLLEQFPYPDPLVGEALVRVEATQKPLTHASNEEIRNRISQSLWGEYNARFAE